MEHPTNRNLLRCAIYIRVSTAEQAVHGKSLQAQRECLERYAAENGMIVAGVYADEGQSARKELRKRKAIHRLLKSVEQDEIDVILFWKMDRWFRSVSDFYKVQEILDAHGVRWIAAAEPNMNMETRDGRLNLNIMLSIGQNEVDTTSERIRFTVENMVKNGRAVWGDACLPLGYRIAEVDGIKRVVKNPKEEVMVHECFSYFRTWQNKRQTVFHMQETFGIDFSYTQLRTMLSSELYIGKYRENTNYCPAYLTLDEWEEIQQLSNNNIRKARSGRIYYFSSLICCPHCGQKLSGCGVSSIISRKTGEKRAYCYYRCNKAVMEHLCTYRRRVSQNLVESYLLENLEKEYRGYQIRYKAVLAKNKKKKSRSTEKIASEMERLNILFQKGRVSMDYYEKEYDALEKELRQAEALPAKGKNHARVEALLTQDVNEIYFSLTPESKQAFWRNIIEKIYIDENNRITGVDFL